MLSLLSYQIDEYIFPHLNFLGQLKLIRAGFFLAVGSYNFIFFGECVNTLGGLFVVLPSSIVKSREVSVQEIARILE